MNNIRIYVAVAFAGLAAVQGGMSQIVGTVGTVPIAMSEIRSSVEGKLFRIQTEGYEAQKQNLIARVNALLLEAECKRQGMTHDELLNSEVYSRVVAPSAAEIEVAAEASQVPVATEVLRQMIVGKRRTLARRTFEQSLWLRYKPDLNFPPPRWPERLDAASAPRLGPPEARLRIVIFSDFECVYCARLAAGLRGILAKSADASVSYRHFPLESHGTALPAAQFAVCAQRKGKFWPFHDRLFQDSTRMTIERIRDAWTFVGLSESDFGQCLEDERAKQSVHEDAALAGKLDLLGTPSVFVNERLVLTGGNLEMLEEILVEERDQLFSRHGHGVK